MRKGWYIYCPSCGAQVFLSRWKPIAIWMFRRCRWRRYEGCSAELTLIWKAGTDGQSVGDEESE